MNDIFIKYLINSYVINTENKSYYDKLVVEKLYEDNLVFTLYKFINNKFVKQIEILYYKRHDSWLLRSNIDYTMKYLGNNNSYFPPSLNTKKFYFEYYQTHLVDKYKNKVSPQLNFFNYKNKYIKFNDNIIYYILCFKKYEIFREIYEYILSFIRIIEINNKLI